MHYKNSVESNIGNDQKEQSVIYQGRAVWNYNIQKMIEEKSREEKKILNEELFRVDLNDLTNILHRSIVALTFLTPYKQYAVGTGFLISANLVLTAAHNLYEKRYNLENEDFKLYCQVKGEIEQFYQIQSYKYPDNFKSCSKSSRMEHDFALLKLKKPLPFKQYMPLSLVCKKCLLENNKRTNLQIYGFPAGSQDNACRHRTNYSCLNKDGRRKKLFQYGLGRENRIISIEPDKFTLSYAISTFPGQSGSPVCIGDRIVAIHNGGGKDYQNFNVGRMITVDLLMTLERWNQQLKGKPFQKIEYLPCPHLKENELRTMVEKQNYQLKTLRMTLQSRQQQIAKLKEQQSDSEEIKSNLFRRIQQLQPPVQPVPPKRSENRNGLRQKTAIIYQPGNMSQRPTVNEFSRKNLLEPIKFDVGAQNCSLNQSKKGLRSIDLHQYYTNLTCLNLSDNKLTEINLSSNVLLSELWLSGNQIKEIDLRLNINLTKLYLFQNQLTSIDLLKNCKLIRLSLHHNDIKQLNLRACRSLECAYLDENALGKLIMWYMAKLEQLSLHHQRAEECNIVLFHHKDDEQRCSQTAKDNIEKYNKKDDLNRNRCRYKVRLQGQQ